MSETAFQGTSTKFVFSEEFLKYTIVPNYIFECKELSFKAVGMYCSIVRWQNSDKHKISVRSLMKEHKDGQISVQSGLNELIEHGFITREQIRNDRGHIESTVYTVYVKPRDRS